MNNKELLVSGLKSTLLKSFEEMEGVNLSEDLESNNIVNLTDIQTRQLDSVAGQSVYTVVYTFASINAKQSQQVVKKLDEVFNKEGELIFCSVKDNG